jgi:hypothetical protein
MCPKIHHYTTAETLGLILASRKIRFNRADGVDDVKESERHPLIRFGKYFYLSCWTSDEEESIPLWHKYADGMRGVRISFPPYPLKKKRLVAPPQWQVEQGGVLYAPLSLEEQFGEDYLLLPTHMSPEQFGGPVEYCDDVETRYTNAISISIENDQARISMRAPYDLVRLKTRDWEFQREYRFALFALPSIPVPPEGPGSREFYEQVPSHMVTALLKGIGPRASYVDVDLSEGALEQMEVTLGPLCGTDMKRRVKAVIDAHAPSAIIRESRLTGKVR